LLLFARESSWRSRVNADNGAAATGSTAGRNERTLGEKIEWLIQHMWPEGAAPPRTNADIAAAITAATGEEMSSTSIWKLRTGRGDNPTQRTLTALATFFKVPVGYFFEGEEAEQATEQVALLALMREKGTGATLRSLAGISSRGRRHIAEMIESVARMEKDHDGGTSHTHGDG
jgi:transcriptional regulator with XRE-family HTH domain